MDLSLAYMLARLLVAKHDGHVAAAYREARRRTETTDEWLALQWSVASKRVLWLGRGRPAVIFIGAPHTELEHYFDLFDREVIEAETETWSSENADARPCLRADASDRVRSAVRKACVRAIMMNDDRRLTAQAASAAIERLVKGHSQSRFTAAGRACTCGDFYCGGVMSMGARARITSRSRQRMLCLG